MNIVPIWAGEYLTARDLGENIEAVTQRTIGELSPFLDNYVSDVESSDLVEFGKALAEARTMLGQLTIALMETGRDRRLSINQIAQLVRLPVEVVREIVLEMWLRESPDKEPRPE